MNSIPLADALPWETSSPPWHGTTILVTDSIETDGRFLLHTLASQYISATDGHSSRRSEQRTHERNMQTNTTHFNSLKQRVIWVSCDSLLEKHVIGALKKIGCDTSKLPSFASLSSSRRSISRNGDNGNWHFISVTDKLSESILNNTDHESSLDTRNETENFAESCAKSLCKEVRHLMTDKRERKESDIGATCPLIVLDNVSSLAEILGEAYTYAIIQQIRATLDIHRKGCLLMRCSNELQDDTGSMSTMLSKDRSTGWMCFGGQEDNARATNHTSNFENGLLVEIADCIIDVLPLQSGFSNEAHGRLVLTERLGGRGWTHPVLHSPKDSRRNQQPPHGKVTSSRGATTKNLKRRTFNFVCSDNQVKAIHLRAQA